MLRNEPHIDWLPIETCPRDPRRSYLLFTTYSNTEVGFYDVEGSTWRSGHREIDPLFWSPTPTPPDGLSRCDNCVRVVPTLKALPMGPNKFCGDACLAEFCDVGSDSAMED